MAVGEREIVESNRFCTREPYSSAVRYCKLQPFQHVSLHGQKRFRVVVQIFCGVVDAMTLVEDGWLAL